jgi:hypothetical protein
MCAMERQEFKVFRALGLSFRALFRNFVPFMALTALLYSPVVLWVTTIDFTTVSSFDELLDTVFVWPLYAVTALATLLTPMITYRVIQDLNGVKVPMLTSIKHGARGIAPAILLALIVNLIQLVPFGGIVGAILLCVYFVATPAAVAERLGPFAAFQRSGELTLGRRGGIFGLTFLVGLVGMGLILVWIIPMLENPDAEVLANLRTTSVIVVAVIGLLQMFTGIVEAVSYALLRKDKDGTSYESLAKVFE